MVISISIQYDYIAHILLHNLCLCLLFSYQQIRFSVLFLILSNVFYNCYVHFIIFANKMRLINSCIVILLISIKGRFLLFTLTGEQNNFCIY